VAPNSAHFTPALSAEQLDAFLAALGSGFLFGARTSDG
jgi:hypothetical protein